MKLIPYILIIALSLSCKNQLSLKQTQEQQSGEAANGSLDNRQTRPQETGEGLPGYLHCQSSAEDTSAEIDCRLQAENDDKIDLSGKNDQWSFEGDPSIQVKTTLLPENSPWHANFKLTGSNEAIQKSLDSGVVTASFDGKTKSSPLAETLDSTTPDAGPEEPASVSNNVEVFTAAQSARILFGPGSSGRAQQWLGLDLTTPTPTPLPTQMTTPLGSVNYQVIPNDGNLTPEGPRDPAGATPWLELGGSGIGAENSFEIAGSLTGSYRLAVSLGNLFMSTATTVTFEVMTGEAQAPISIAVSPNNSATPDATNFIEFQAKFTNDFRVRLRADPPAKMVLHGVGFIPEN
ncbi:hypothetical protein [Pseudobacteriovorax antillogorgiicola]|uniref:Uncharacterized protein n=1 Tax=Pseudobacteriovorax antillogorgiicola TaxID=1513793 RepID=A0A1Y6CPK5_9BACT|nr:hypothetical protein [Pseudobacteriovorax antillogorgiicola]TCS43635.1 hypothetical protein EDD56_13528 [Pseudobacteriovorax antillogorgiicola]SMF79977.1 hypothetical protein SAMN06296036_13425 [Pseudobacteriovorax antillogorgiicola]